MSVCACIGLSCPRIMFTAGVWPQDKTVFGVCVCVTIRLSYAAKDQNRTIRQRVFWLWHHG